jgi:predicted transcriptional regulator of viral defense system
LDQSIHNQIIRRVLSFKKGKIIFPSDFTDLAPINTVNQNLSRLVKNKKLIRLGQGLYYIAKLDPELGVILPSIEQIAAAIARRDKVELIPTGSYALHKLGISTQVPTRAVFLTNGSPRRIKVGHREITLKKTTPKRLLVKGKTNQLVIQALSELGPKAITATVLAKIHQALLEEDPERIRKDARLAPAWISKIMIQSLENR